jgi:hypothetical protein
VYWFTALLTVRGWLLVMVRCLLQLGRLSSSTARFVMLVLSFLALCWFVLLPGEKADDAFQSATVLQVPVARCVIRGPDARGYCLQACMGAFVTRLARCSLAGERRSFLVRLLFRKLNALLCSRRLRPGL